ncbi:MAG TPA: hypothetical protein VKQ70_12260 [Caulobacteraceae bacterium]|jgi:hypothetical protein|nr:hypothetical protein [Caulobacteraceae bacterium]
MSKRLSALSACLAFAGTLGFASHALSATPARTDSCFMANDWEGWKSPNPNVIYVRVGVSRIYEFDLSAGSNQLQEPDMHLVSKIRGSNWICDPLDLQLQLADNHGAFEEPLFVKSIRKLSPEEIAAIPKRDLP